MVRALKSLQVEHKFEWKLPSKLNTTFKMFLLPTTSRIWRWTLGNRTSSSRLCPCVHVKMLGCTRKGDKKQRESCY